MLKLVAVFAALTLWLPATAYCCLNGITLSSDEAAKEVKRMEGLLLAGKYSTVVDMANELDFPRGPLLRRVELLELVASTRLKARQKPMARSGLGTLLFGMEQLHKQNPADPLLQARLAEVMALSEGEQEGARKLIEALVEHDLMPDAEAWATAAHLRALANDGAGSGEALARCKQIAGKRKHACTLPLV